MATVYPPAAQPGAARRLRRPPTRPVPAAALAAMLADAGAQTQRLIAGLDDGQLAGSARGTVNPLLWDLGHIAWFYERFVLRGLDGRPSLRPGGGRLYDSIRIHDAMRWGVELPRPAETLDYLDRVRAALAGRLPAGMADEADSYFTQLTVFHEDMHGEDIAYGRQALDYSAPAFDTVAAPDDAGPLPGDAEVPGGVHVLGASPDAPFVFDNEKWGHPLPVAPFRIARAPVTNAAFAAFVDDGGYARRDWWSGAGWAWRAREEVTQPLYWQRDGAGWAVRRFDGWERLRPHAPMVHVSWHEAEAWCRWAGRRLPTELEWEVAASRAPAADGTLAPAKRRYPWGDDAPAAAHANLDGRAGGTVDVAAHPDGDSAFGCRQMLGNVWEWTADVFAPYPGFTADAYREYSAPWFYDHKVLRGGSWVTRSRGVWNTWRNFYKPHRRDLFAGFRTCAV